MIRFIVGPYNYLNKKTLFLCLKTLFSQISRRVTYSFTYAFFKYIFLKYIFKYVLKIAFSYS